MSVDRGAIPQEGNELKKALLVATLAAAPMLAQASHDRATGVVAGGLTGALIGSSVDGRQGAAVGGILGALADGYGYDYGYRDGYRGDGRRYY